MILFKKRETFKKNNFRFTWVSANELAVGSIPKNKTDRSILKSHGIKGVLSLCSNKEVKEEIPDNIFEDFNHQRIILPDHKVSNKLTINEILKALEALNILMIEPPAFVHCVASMERSPLICIAWLIKTKNLSFSHEPVNSEDNKTLNICGHYHPKIYLKNNGDRLSFRCFAMDIKKNTLYLPSFGDLTGGYPCKKAFKKWAILSENEILEI